MKKCNFCGKNFDEHNGVKMYADGELIAEYCSFKCRSNASQRMIARLEQTGRESSIKFSGKKSRKRP